MKRLWGKYINSFRGLPGASWILAWVVLINRSGSMVLVFMTLYLVHRLGVSPASAAVVISLYGVGGMAGTLIGGALADRIGHKRVQTISLVLNGLGYLALAHVHSLHDIRIMMFLIGLVAESFRPANAAAVGDACSPNQLARAYALNRLAVNVGSTIGPAAGGLLVLVGYRFLFWADGLTCLAAAAFLAAFYRQPPPEETVEADMLSLKLISPLKDVPFLIFSIVILVYGILFMQLLSTFPLFMSAAYHLNATVIGLMFATNAVLCATIEMPLISRLQHVQPIRVVSVGIACFAIGFSLLPLGSTGIFAVFTVVIWTMGEILSFPQFSATVAARAGRARRGRYMGIYTLTFSTAMVIGPAIGGFVYEKIGSTFLWLAYIPIGLLMLLVLHTWARPMFTETVSPPKTPI